MAFQKIRRLRFIELVVPASPKQLADADARTRRRQYQKLLLSPPGTPSRPVAVVITAG
jgi:hypothetical protein